MKHIVKEQLSPNRVRYITPELPAVANLVQLVHTSKSAQLSLSSLATSLVLLLALVVNEGLPQHLHIAVPAALAILPIMGLCLGIGLTPRWLDDLEKISHEEDDIACTIDRIMHSPEVSYVPSLAYYQQRSDEFVKDMNAALADEASGVVALLDAYRTIEGNVGSASAFRENQRRLLASLGEILADAREVRCAKADFYSTQVVGAAV